jgi:hypothetical protein
MSRTCEVDGCGRRGRLSRGMCHTHYMRWRLRGDPGGGSIGAYGRTKCEAEGCDRAHFTHGYCKMHYSRWKSNGDPLVVGNVGAAHHLWAGTNIGYRGQHDRLRSARGPASSQMCRHCAAPADEWAYDHADPQERRDDQTGLPFSSDLGRYIPLCKSCHQLFDNAYRLVAI